MSSSPAPPSQQGAHRSATHLLPHLLNVKPVRVQLWERVTDRDARRGGHRVQGGIQRLRWRRDTHTGGGCQKPPLPCARLVCQEQRAAQECVCVGAQSVPRSVGRAHSGPAGGWTVVAAWDEGKALHAPWRLLLRRRQPLATPTTAPVAAGAAPPALRASVARGGGATGRVSRQDADGVRSKTRSRLVIQSSCHESLPQVSASARGGVSRLFPQGASTRFSRHVISTSFLAHRLRTHHSSRGGVSLSVSARTLRRMSVLTT